MVILLYGPSDCLLKIFIYSLLLSVIAFPSASTESCSGESPNCVCSFESLKFDLKETILNSSPDELMSRIKAYKCQEYLEIPPYLIATMNDNARPHQRSPKSRTKAINRDQNFMGRLPKFQNPKSPPREDIPLDEPSVQQSQLEPFSEEPPRGYFPEEIRGRSFPNQREIPRWGLPKPPQRGRPPPHQPHFGFSHPHPNPHVPPFPEYIRGRRNRRETPNFKEKKLQQTVPKLPQSKSHTIYAFLGHQIKISCALDNQFIPGSKFTWAHGNGDPVSAPAASINDITGDLVIPTAQLSDTGAYNCTNTPPKGQPTSTTHQLSIVTDAIHWLSVSTLYDASPCSSHHAKLVETNIPRWIRKFICTVCTVHESSVICDRNSGSNNYNIKFAVTAFNFENEIDGSLNPDVCSELCVQALHLLLLNIMRDSLLKLFALPIQAGRGMLKPVVRSTIFELMTGCLAGFEYHYEICCKGHFSLRGESDCVQCSHGKYQPSSGASACLPCGSGEDTIEDGATNVDACLPESVVDAYHTAEENSTVAVALGIIFSIIIFLIIIVLLICCGCPHTKFGQCLRKCFCYPCTLSRWKSKVEKINRPSQTERRKSIVTDVEQKSKAVGVVSKNEIPEGKKLFKRLAPKVIRPKMSTVVKYAQLNNGDTTPTIETSENESDREAVRRSVQVQVERRSPKSKTQAVAVQSTNPAFDGANSRQPNRLRHKQTKSNGDQVKRPSVLNKATNVGEQRNRTVADQQVPNTEEFALFSSEGEADVEHGRNRVKDTVAKINAANAFQKFRRGVSNGDRAESAQLPTRSDARVLSGIYPKSRDRKIEQVTSTRNRQSLSPQVQTTNLDDRVFGHEGPGRYYQDDNESRARGMKPYLSPPLASSLDNTLRRPRESSSPKVLEEITETSADEEQLMEDQWEKYCHTCVKPSFKKKQFRQLPPPPPALPE